MSVWSADRAATALTTALARGSQVGMGAVPYQIALELGKRAEDVAYQHPAWRGGIDLLGERAETHAARRQLADFLEQVAHRTPKTIEFPDHQRVAGTQIGERLGQAGPIGFCSRCIIVEYAIATGNAQRVELQRQLLCCGRDAPVAEKTHQ